MNLTDLDFYGDADPSATLTMALRDSSDQEGFRKMASSIEQRSAEQVRSLADSQFGLVTMTKEGGKKRSFPLDSPGEVWLSSIYFGKNAGEMTNMAQAITAKNISHSAQIFGVDIDETITKVANDFPNIRTNVYVEGNDFPMQTASQGELSKTAEARRDPNRNDTRYWGLSNGERLRYPLKDEEQVKLASVYFSKHAKAFSPIERHEFSSKILARGIEYGIGEEIASVDSIAKHAGVGYGTRLQAGMIDRLSYCKELGINGKDYQELSKFASVMKPAEFSVALEVADERNGLTRFWDNGIDDPYASTYGNHVKQASYATVEIDGVTIKESQLKGIDASKFKATFETTMWNSFSKNPVEIFESLPKPEQRLIANMVSGVTV